MELLSQIPLIKIEKIFENKDETGGLSGSPLKEISNKLIKKFYTEIKDDFPIMVSGVLVLE